MTAHAYLSPSSAEKWLTCTPSVKLEQQFKPVVSDYAEEGTLAHRLGELMIRYKLGLITKQKYKQDLKIIQDHKLYQDAMLDYIDDYASFVIEAYNGYKNAYILLEERVNLTEYIKEGFGTTDVQIISPTTLEIIDLKYGQGVPVSATANKQMMLYALGALITALLLHDIELVRLTIYQPRLDNYSTYDLPVKRLLQWAESELREKADLAYKGEGEYVAGTHCRFCRAKAVCKAFADYNLELMKHDFAVPATLDPDEIADVLGKVKLLQEWVKAVQEYALQEALAGKKFPGWKLVEGRSNRKYTDEIEVAKRLLSDGLSEEEIYTKKVKGITELEGLIGKAKFAALLDKFLIKPTGKPALVPLDNKKPELNSLESAIKDFSQIKF